LGLNLRGVASPAWLRFIIAFLAVGLRASCACRKKKLYGVKTVVPEAFGRNFLETVKKQKRLV
jgi:hypothetical protein